MFKDVAEFQDWVMYDTGPVNDLSGWTWANLMNRVPDDATETPTWESQWVEQAKETGIENPNDRK